MNSLDRAKELLKTIEEIENRELIREKITMQHGELLERIDNWDMFIRRYYEFLKD